MGERKVLNKYFPPDFDPKKVPRLKRDPLKQIGVRMMIPFSMQCNTCGEFMYRGKKFNSLKEDCIGEDYVGIKKFRFYIKCVICSQEITFKTDPEKGDYELETGASRNFESWTDKQATEEAHKKEREEEEKSDNMKQLENRTLDSKIEMEIMDALDEIKAVNRRHETVDTAEVLKAAAARREKGAAAGSVSTGAGPSARDNLDEDDAMIAKIQFGGEPTVRRLSDGEDSDNEALEKMSRNLGDPLTVARGKGNAKGNKHAKGKGIVVDGSSLSSLFATGVSTASGNPRLKEGLALSNGGEGGAPVPSQAGGGAEDSKGDASSGGGGDSSTPGSLLVSGIEAAARREAEKSKPGAEGSIGTKILAKRKKLDKPNDRKKKHKKSKNKSKIKGKDGSKEKSASAGEVASGSGGGLGSLLGFYASSSSSSDADEESKR